MRPKLTNRTPVAALRTIGAALAVVSILWPVAVNAKGFRDLENLWRLVGLYEVKTGLAPSAEVGAEIVPYNDVYALDFGIDDQWRRAYRAVDSQAPFEYRKFDCLVTITLMRQRESGLAFALLRMPNRVARKRITTWRRSMPMSSACQSRAR